MPVHSNLWKIQPPIGVQTATPLPLNALAGSPEVMAGKPEIDYTPYIYERENTNHHAACTHVAAGLREQVGYFRCFALQHFYRKNESHQQSCDGDSSCFPRNQRQLVVVW